MAQATAPKRSIDEIIGSIRSIVRRTPDEGGSTSLTTANDPGVPSGEIATDLTGVPEDGGRVEIGRMDTARVESPFAEPVAPPFEATLEATFEPDVADLAELSERFESGTAALRDASHTLNAPVDPAQMAEIAAVVERNLAEVDFEARERDAASNDRLNTRTDTPSDPQTKADGPSFGRRSAQPGARPFESVEADAAAEALAAPVETPRPVEVDQNTAEDTLEDELGAFLAAGRSPQSETALPPAHEAIAALHAKMNVEEPVAKIDGAQATEADVRTGSIPTAPVPVPATVPFVPHTPTVGDGTQVVGDPTLDEEMLRPIIREWLDDNLPPMVERLVREELERAMNGRAD